MPDDDRLPARISLPRDHALAAVEAARAAQVPIIQPHPWQTCVGYLPVRGGTVTAVVRHWNKGDPAQCALCPRCTVFNDVCAIMVDGRVSADDAPLFNMRPRRIIVRAGGPGPTDSEG